MRARRHPAHARTQHRTDRDPGGDGTLVPGLRDVGHHRARPARRPRRPEARPPADPVRDVRRRAAARPQAPEERRRRRRRHGQVPPARRHRDLRRAGAHGTGLLPAVPAHRRPRELRHPRPQRPAGGNALHRVAAGATGDAVAGRDRRGHRRLHTDLRRQHRRAGRAAGEISQPPGQRRRRDRRRYGDEHPAAQPRGGDRRGAAPARQPRGHQPGPHAVRAGPRLPVRRVDPRAQRDPRRLHDRSRLDQDAGRRRGGGDPQGRPPHRRDRGAVPDVGRGDRPEDRRARERPQDRGHPRRPQRVVRRHHPPHRRAQARRQRAGGAEPALQAHADADQLPGAHAGAGRQRPQVARPQDGTGGLRRPPEGDHPAAHRVPPAQGQGAGAHRRGPGEGARHDRRHHRPDPGRRGRRHRPHRPHGGAVRVHRDPGQLHPRHAAAPPHPARGSEAPRRARGAAAPPSPSCSRSSTARPSSPR